MSWKDELDDDYIPDTDPIDKMDSGMWVGMVGAFLVLGFLALWFFLAWTPDTEGANRILQEEGYTDVHITGADPMMCGHGDLKGTKFRAKNQAGNVVRGVVCCGAVFKGCTIRR